MHRPVAPLAGLGAELTTHCSVGLACQCNEQDQCRLSALSFRGKVEKVAQRRLVPLDKRETGSGREVRGAGSEGKQTTCLVYIPLAAWQDAGASVPVICPPFLVASALCRLIFYSLLIALKNMHGQEQEQSRRVCRFPNRPLPNLPSPKTRLMKAALQHSKGKGGRYGNTAGESDKVLPGTRRNWSVFQNCHSVLVLFLGRVTQRRDDSPPHALGDGDKVCLLSKQRRDSQ